MKKTEAQSPRKGMNRGTHPSEIGEQEYTYALNTNIQSEQTGGSMILQNEPSNTLCSKFKDNYIVLKAKYDRVKEVTYFFLLNEETGCSEIGKINTNREIEPNQAISKMCGCDPIVILEEGLENTEEITGHCEYQTLISDCCSTGSKLGEGCLNFSKSKPIKDVVIRHSTWGDELYFTDGFNPQRYLRLDYLDEYKIDKDPCTGKETEYCIDCDKLRLLPLYSFPCLVPDVIQNGGNLPAGVYETFLFYCDERGEIITHAIASTNPISIFDDNNKIISQATLDYKTDLAYSIDVDFADKHYDYYKVVITYSSGINPAPQYYDYGVYGIEQDRILVATLPNTKNTVTEYDILTQKPSYKTAEGMEEVNGYLFQNGLTTQREINLQKVVNLMGSFAKWMTYKAEEDVFKDGINSAKYKGRMRDETYPEGLQFELEGGHRTAIFPLISRPSKGDDLDEYIDINGAVVGSNLNVESINEYVSECTTSGRRYKWQYENTASVSSTMCEDGSAVDTSSYEQEVTCESELYVITEGEIDVPDSDFIEWINNHKEDILNDVYDYPEIKEALLAEYSDCELEFEGNCDEPVLKEESVDAVGMGTYGIVTRSVDCKEYTKTPPPNSCNPLLRNEEDIVITPSERYTEVEEAISSTAVVYKKNPISNGTCGTAINATTFLNGAEADGHHLVDMVSIDNLSLLQTDIDVSCCNATDSEFSTKLHSNVAWFKADFLAYEQITIEISNVACGFADSNTSNKIRVAAWDGCPTGSNTEKTSLCRCLDLTDTSCSSRFLTFNKADFKQDTVYISIDSPLKERLEVKFNITTPGIGDIEIDGETYLVTGNTAELLVQNFKNTNEASLLSEEMDLIVPSDETYFSIMMTREQFDSIILTPSNDGGFRMNYEIDHIHYRLSPPCGCFSVVLRETETREVTVYTNLEFRKKYTYTLTCTQETSKIYGNCDPVPYKYGDFAYTESIFKYPCNEELYDSSTLKISPEDIPSSIKSEFEDYFSNGVVGGKYNLNNNTNFIDKPIRHFKYPDNRVSPYMHDGTTTKVKSNQAAHVFPIGFHLSNEVINAFLDIAVKNDIITTEERSRIVGYEVFRGDRRTQRSIIARGTSANMMQYSDKNSDKVLYPNFPFNTRQGDIINQIGSANNNSFTFTSPDTLFNSPTLPSEVTIDGYLTGGVTTTFAPMQDHPTYVILANKARKLANKLAAAEIGLEISMQSAEIIFQAFDAGGGTYLSAVNLALKIAAGVALTAVVVGAVFKAGKYRYQWLDTFEGMGQGYNHAYIALGECDYNNFIPNTQANSLYRGLDVSTYLDAGDVTVRDEKGKSTYKVNNYNRESSVMLKFGEGYKLTYIPEYDKYENGQAQIRTTQTGEFSQTVANGKAMKSGIPFMTLKQYLPGQWGEINSVPWLPTNSCNKLNSNNACTAVFGGDIFISRFYTKKKFPIFRKTAHGLPPDTPYKYSRYLNVNNKDWKNSTTAFVGFIDYKTHNSDFVKQMIFPENKSAYTLFTGNNVVGTTVIGSNLVFNEPVDEFYVTDAWKFLVEYFSIPSFLVESEINCNYRYGREGTESALSDDFAPNVINRIDWVQKSNVPMSTKEKFFYNWVYSKANYRKAGLPLPTDFKREEADKKNNLKNSLIYSRKDDDTNSLRAPWRQYKANDAHTFSRGNGELIDVNGIESDQVLVRFSDGYSVLGATDPIRDRLTAEQQALGIGHIFSEKALNFNKTDLGYAGTQNTTFLSTPIGHYWVDAKRGGIYELQPNAKGMSDITVSMSKWFKDQLPFKILKYYPNVDIDNNYNGVGLSMGYDSVFTRILLTKKDYVPIDLDNIVQCGNQLYNAKTGVVERLKRQGETDGWRYKEVKCNELIFIKDDRGERKEKTITLPLVDYTDKTMFEDVSWTAGYSPLTKSWISYYSFEPNYYVGYNEYFQTGINSLGNKEHGIWSHYPFISSYQVFYGKLHPFVIEYSKKTNGIKGVITDVNFWLDVRKYTNKYDFSDIYGTGFNKAYVYNDFQNTGLLELVPQKTNNRSQIFKYPKYKKDSVEILQSEVEGMWSFNHLYNAIRNERSGLPIWLNDKTDIIKNINKPLLDYSARRKDRVRGDYFLVRLEQDKESRFKMMFKSATENIDYYR